MKNKYETVFALSLKTFPDDEALEAAVEKFKGVMIENGATIESVDVWGKRRMAYAVNYEAEAYYAVIVFESEPAFPAELERIYHITDGVLRSIVVKK